jgi:hypothetical protein
MTDKTRRDDSQPAAGGKKPYTRPTVTEYGSVAKLTLVKGMTDLEGSQPATKKCL